MIDYTYRFRNVVYNLSKRTHLMGIMNITPDSFSDGGIYFDGKVNIKKIVEDVLKTP